MKLSQLLVESRVVADVRDLDKNKLLQRIAELFARDLPGASAGQILSRLQEREEVASTGIGDGIALPHARISLSESGGKWLSTPMSVLVRIKGGMEFSALDGQPVFLVMALISATENREDHLRALSVCSQILHQAETRKRLMAARDGAAMLTIAMGNRDKEDSSI